MPQPKRRWGSRFNLIQSPPPSPGADAPAESLSLPPVVEQAEVVEGATQVPRTHATAPKMPHEASVFVASLPTHLPDADLEALLQSNFEKYGRILHIKLLHDSRGPSNGQTSEQAQEVIKQCHLSYLEGRLIRCEIARAFRTLLLSFHLKDGFEPGQTTPPVECVRLRRRFPGSKFVEVMLNREAQNTPNITARWDVQNDPLEGPGMLFALNDKSVSKSQLVRSLASAFGSLESCRPVQIGNFPPHPASVLPLDLLEAATGEEETGTWEIKWTHRNDAVLALNALRQVPALIISWAHISLAPLPVQTHPGKAFHSIDHVPTPVKEAEVHTLRPAMRGKGKVLSLVPQPHLSNTSIKRSPVEAGWLIPSVMKPAFRRNEKNDPKPYSPNIGDTNGAIQTTPPPPLSPTHSTTLPTPSTIGPLTPSPVMRFTLKPNRRLERNSVFINGLIKGAWDEQRVMIVFSQYGTIEEVRLMDTLAFKRHACCVIKFKREESASQAITHEDQRVYDGTPIRVYVKIHGFHRPPGSMEFGGHLHKENHQAQSEERVHNVGLGLTNASLCESVEIVEPEDGLVRRWEGIAVAQVDTIERSVCVEPITEGNRLVEQLEDSVEVQDIPSSATTTSGVAAEDLAVPSPPKLRVRGIDDQSFATNTSGGSPVPRPRPRPRHRSLSDPTVRVSSRMISVAPSARSASDPTTDTVALPDLLGDLSIGDSQGDQYLEQSLATPPFSPSLNGVFLEAGGGGGGFPNVGPPMHVPWYPAYNPYMAFMGTPPLDATLSPNFNTPPLNFHPESSQRGIPPLNASGFGVGMGMLIPMYPPEALEQYMARSKGASGSGAPSWTDTSVGSIPFWQPAHALSAAQPALEHPQAPGTGEQTAPGNGTDPQGLSSPAPIFPAHVNMNISPHLTYLGPPPPPPRFNGVHNGNGRSYQHQGQGRHFSHSKHRTNYYNRNRQPPPLPYANAQNPRHGPSNGGIRPHFARQSHSFGENMVLGHDVAHQRPRSHHGKSRQVNGGGEFGGDITAPYYAGNGAFENGSPLSVGVGRGTGWGHFSAPAST